MYYFELLLFLAPALLLALLAQVWMRSAYAKADRMAARMTGAAAAEEILRANGINNVGIEQVPGHLSDHYDPRHKMLRLSPNVFHGRSLAAVGIAAHEVGHAIQDARQYAPLVVRNLAVPAASFGSSAGMILLILGLIMGVLAAIVAGHHPVQRRGGFSDHQPTGGVQRQQPCQGAVGRTGYRQRGPDAVRE